MSNITSVQSPQEINGTNPTQDLQKSSSLHGRAFHKITEGGKYIIQSINNIAQSVLSTCIRVVSFGRYNLDSLKSYLFSNQPALKGDETAIPSNLPSRSAPPLTPSNAPPPPPPPPPPLRMPTQEPITLRAGSADVRSSVNPTQDSPEEGNNILRDSANPRSPSLHEDSDPVIEAHGNNEPSASLQVKKKGIRKEIKQTFQDLFAGAQNNPLFQRKQKELNPEQSN